MFGTWQTDDPRAMITTARVPIAVVAIAGLILALAPQMRDMLAAIGDDWNAALRFQLAAAAWGLSSWYWTRTALVALHGEDTRSAPGMAGWTFRWLPRLVLSFAFVILALMLLSGGGGARFGTNLFLFALTWFVLLLFVVYRTRIFPTSRGEEVHSIPPAPLGRWLASLPERAVTLLRAAPGGPAVAIVLLLVAPVGLGWWAAHDVIGFARAFPGAASALIGLAAIVPVATFAVALLDQWDLPVLRRFPVVAAVLLWSLAVDTPFVHRHPVRTVIDTPRLPAERVTIEEAAKAWLETCARNDPDPKVVIVAAAGGASRAALWMTTVLADLEARAGLHRNLFAISAVSGGALGAAVHLAAREEAGLRCTVERAPAGLARRADRAIGADFLGPPLAAYLFQDTWQLMTGWAQVLYARLSGRPLTDVLVADRAAAIEDAFARAWNDGKAGGRLDRAFLASWYGSGSFDATLPLLFQNGAEVGSGRRIITAPVSLDPRLPPARGDMRASPFGAATDQLALAGADVRLSTSVTNSARFPYVTPAGEVTSPEGYLVQVVDGGYVDNLGARTAWEIADALVAAGAEIGRTVVPIIVAITPHGEQALPSHEAARCDNRGVPMPVPRAERQSEAIAPLIGLAGTRAGHNALALETLRGRYCPSAADARQRFFHFYLPALCERAGQSGCEDVPLNWVLSRRMREHILAQMQADPWNRAEADRLAALLRR
jgi:hypothetical protein